MATRNSALLLVLLLGAFSSCASAYYFPNGPPNRPSRQATNPDIPDDGALVPEPKQLLPDVPDVPKVIQLKASPVIQLSRQVDDQEKPEPRPFPGIQMVPEEKRDMTRQTSSCQQNYSFAQAGQSVQIESPNYPNEYPNNVLTSTCFTSPSGTTMSVNCDDFNVEQATSCRYDYFGIGYGGSPSNIQKYCGRGTLSSTASTGNSLAIVFKSDGSNPGASRRSPYKFRCRITVSGSSSAPAPSPPSPPSSGGNCNCGRRNDGSRIVGGQDAKVNELPWRCFLRTSTRSFFCGCSIISNKWIMTAAHCTAAVRGEQISVVVGDHDRSTTAETVSQTITVDKVVQHQQYNSRTYDNDMSLLRLSRSITYSNTISPVCIPFKYPNDDFNGTTVLASGWGTTTEGGSVSNTLKEVGLPVLTTQQCSSYYPGQITNNMICTYSPGKDTCQGDSGGSIDLNRGGRYYGIGVVSWGIGCARNGRPGVYAKTNNYLDWIRQNSEGETFCEA